MKQLKIIAVTFLFLMGFSSVATAQNLDDLGVTVQTLLDAMGPDKEGFTFQTRPVSKDVEVRWIGDRKGDILLISGENETANATALQLTILINHNYDGSNGARFLEMTEVLDVVFPLWPDSGLWLLSAAQKLSVEKGTSMSVNGIEITLVWQKRDKSMILTLLPE